MLKTCSSEVFPCRSDRTSHPLKPLRIHNQSSFRDRVTFADLAHHFMKLELNEHSDSVDTKAMSMIYIYRHILNDYVVMRRGKRIALGIEPLEIEKWLQALRREKGLANPTLDKTRRVMSLVYKHSQRHGLIPRGEECNPLRFVRCKSTSDYEAIILTSGQAFSMLLCLSERLTNYGLTLSGPRPHRTISALLSKSGPSGPRLLRRTSNAGLKAVLPRCCSTPPSSCRVKRASV